MRPKVSASLRDALVAEMGSLRAFAVSLCGDKERADDLVQETLFKAWNHLELVQGRHQPQGVALHHPAQHLFLRAAQAAGARSRTPTAAMPRASPPTRRSTATWTCRTFAPRWSSCPTTSARRSILVGAAGFSYEEAAEICGCAVGTIKSRVNRARNRLAGMLGLEDEERRPVDWRAQQIGLRRYALYRSFADPRLFSGRNA